MILELICIHLKGAVVAYDGAGRKVLDLPRVDRAALERSNPDAVVVEFQPEESQVDYCRRVEADRKVAQERRR